MASFCKQCSEALFNEDNRELAASEHNDYRYLYTLCESCGPTVVDRDGKCVGACQNRHGAVPVQTIQEFVDGKMPGA